MFKKYLPLSLCGVLEHPQWCCLNGYLPTKHWGQIGTHIVVSISNDTKQGYFYSYSLAIVRSAHRVYDLKFGWNVMIVLLAGHHLLNLLEGHDAY